MKLTKSQLKELIKQAIVEDIFDKEIKNPKTGNMIKVRTALQLPDEHPANKKAKGMVAKTSIDKGDVGGPSYPNVKKGVKTSKQAKGSVFKKKDKPKDTMQQPFYKISYTDSEGREKTDSMRAKTPEEAKKDFINMNKGRGFKVVKVQKESVNESKKRRFTVKEVRMWMKKLEENRYKKVYNSDARRVAWMVNNEGVELSEMPKSMSKKWTKAQYGRERYLATEFLKSKSEQLSEGSLKKAMQQWKYIEKGLKPKQKKLVQKALKRLKPKMDKNFKNKDYQDYIDGELDIKVPLPDLIFGKGKEFAQLITAYSNAIKEPAFYEGKLTETKFYAFFNKKKHTIDGKSLYDAKQKAITKLKVPKSKVGLLAIVNAKEHDRGGFRFEQKLRQTIREIIKEQLNEAPKPIHHSDAKAIQVPKKDIKKVQKLLKKYKPKSGREQIEFDTKPVRVPGHIKVTTTKKIYNDVIELLMKNNINTRG